MAWPGWRGSLWGQTATAGKCQVGTEVGPINPCTSRYKQLDVCHGKVFAVVRPQRATVGACGGGQHEVLQRNALVMRHMQSVGGSPWATADFWFITHH